MVNYYFLPKEIWARITESQKHLIRGQYVGITTNKNNKIDNI